MNQLKSTFPKLDLRAAEQLGVEVRHDPEHRPNSQLCKDGRRRARRHPLDLTQIHEGFWKRVLIQDIDKCWLWTKAKCGKKMLYGAVGFNGKKFKSHRLSYILYFGSIDKDLCVCHKCDNPPCCNPHHLFLGTHKDNIQDCISKGRYKKEIGEDRYCAKLTEDAVRDIRSNYEYKKFKASVYMQKYGVSRTAIYNALTKVRWKHVI